MATGAQAGAAARGRPRIQEQADAVVAGVLAVAGPRVGGHEYSTRRIALMTGLSQTLVSRAMRRIRRGGDLLRVEHGHRSLRFSAFTVSFPRISVEFSTGGADMPGELQAFDRRATAVMAALRISGADAWPTTRREPGDGVPGDGAAGHPVDGDSLGADTVRVFWEPGQQTWEAFLSQTAGLLEACGRSVDAVPGDLLSALSVRVGQGLHGVRWRRSDPGTGPGTAPGTGSGTGLRAGHADRYGGMSGERDSEPVSDSFSTGWQVPGPGWQGTAGGELSPAEQVAVALRKEITDSGFSAGDRVTGGVLASHMGIRQSVVRAAMRRLADDGLLESRDGVFSLPLVTGADIIDLYAARLQVGTVLLRACAAVPRHRLLGAQTALRMLEAAAERGDAVRVDQADLYFQQELAEAAGLRQSARTFHSLTLRLQMFISVLQLNYGPVVARIVADDRQIMSALVNGNAPVAVWTWGSKLDNAVRHMSAAAAVGLRFDVRLWDSLTGGAGQ
ncbi:MAG: GntR family transcriptional regulator [Corynebacterium provencense]|jgi:DNA-binding GntR family transcriptional regulator|uniref:GntR family transcriptional regulator n=1 Tax=Corynebacterium provencense TaxID=1737425 RepID=UPI002989B234|nr:GntR family transcriptional regulator [Corynebacterium provencense]